jgi:hypothetical protein
MRHLRFMPLTHRDFGFEPLRLKSIMRPLDQFSVGDKGQGKALCHSPIAIVFGISTSLSLPRFRRLKSSLKFCVINYRLKSAAWLAFALPLPAHAIGFSQWLMTNFF